MASLKPLPLPTNQEDNENSNNNPEWDESIAQLSPKSPDEEHNGRMCAHAMVAPNHHDVVGINVDSYTWMTSFAPHVVCRVASNSDGSIVVVSTNNAAVSLLRGKDGKILATRSVSSERGGPAEISFVAGTNNNNNIKDVLAILVPSCSDNDNANSNAENEETETSTTTTTPNVILVSNIDGAKLNDDNMEVVAEAARNMSIYPVTLPNDITALSGCFMSSSTIRFVAGNANGTISLHDYNLADKKATLVKESIVEDRVFVTKLLSLQPAGENYFLVACSYNTADKTIQVCWYDVMHTTMACAFIMPSSKSRRLVALAPLYSSCLEASVLSVAIASKSKLDSVIHVLQVAVEETLGLVVLSHPHVVYEVPLQSTTSSADQLEALDLTPLSTGGAYSFRYRASFGGADLDECGQFSTGEDGKMIGTIRLLLQRGQYDQADELIASQNFDSADDKYAKFHSSEVVLYRLKNVLSSSQMGTQESMEQAKECLQRLTAGAVSGSDVALQYLLDAARTVARWPSQRQPQHAPTVAEYSLALSGMIGAVSTALETAPPPQTSELTNTKRDLEKRLNAMKCLEELTSAESQGVRLNKPFCDVSSPSDVFAALIKEGHFSMAEVLCKSKWGKELTPEVLASAVLEVRPTLDPKIYAHFLKDVAIPSLKAGHEAIPLIRSWACRTADAFDEDEMSKLGLDSSIFLLEIVRDAIQELNQKMHSSFSSNTPFVLGRERKLRVSPRSAMLNSSSTSSDSSVRSEPSPTEGSSKGRTFAFKKKDKQEEPPNPSILELSSMRGGAVKSRLGSLSKVGPKNANFDDDDENESCLDVKIQHAKQLRAARQLGLSRRVLTLRNYARAGGAEHVAKQLVALYSSTAADHDARSASLASKVKPFCDEASLSFDEALVAYTAGLCDSKHTSTKAIVESASIATCCSSLTEKCTASLTVLRAALLCGQCPPCLQQLARDAIDWAVGDPEVKSELEEASRLLVIDEIIRRYCGSGARELFRVENPRHAERLLDFVCRHVDGANVVQDALHLCDAFAHLSKDFAGTLLLQRAVDGEDPGTCSSILNELFSTAPRTALAAGDGALAYCCSLLDELSGLITNRPCGMRVDQYKATYASVCLSGSTVVEVMQSRLSSDSNIPPHSSFEHGGGEFKRLSDLQNLHLLFPAFSDLDVPEKAVEVVKPMALTVTEAVVKNDSENDVDCLLADLRRACSLLVAQDQDSLLSVWCAVIQQINEQIVKETQDGRCIVFVQKAGIFDEIESEDAANVVLSLMLSICTRVSSESSDDLDPLPRMTDVIRLFATAFGRSMARCPESATNATVFLGLMAEAASQVLLRGDGGTGEVLEERRAKICNVVGEGGSDTETSKECVSGARVATPILHPSWYIGDGLLLPPQDALSLSVGFCRELLFNCFAGANGFTANMSRSFELQHFLRERGATAIALRVLAVTNVIALSTPDFTTDVDDDWSAREDRLSPHWGTLKSLAERSLGGSGTGITSQTIDSQLAVSYLLSLPIKQAFKIYKSSLPTAITKRDFTRVITLANVGVIAGGGHNAGHVGWKKQEVLVSQCEKLSSRARWWRILQKYNVEFDPSRFEDKSSLSLDEEGTKGDDSSSKGSLSYVASLIPELIRNSSRDLGKNNSARKLGCRFATAFGLDSHLAAQKHVEFLLSSPFEELEASANKSLLVTMKKQDVRYDLAACERLSKESLSMLSSTMKRSAVLRRCVTALERCEGSSTDYERHALLLAIYHAELSSVVAQDQTIRNLDATPFEDELELIDRRRDALEILSSFFQDDMKEQRPPFTKFFIPLQVPFRMDSRQDAPRQCGILGAKSGEFDALEPLQPFMSRCSDSGALAALAPLGIPLGLSTGFVHARFLMERFRGTNITPSYDNDVLPVLKRLKSPRDQRDLAEWCSGKYDDGDEQKLRCIDFALTSAMNLSSEIEQRIEIEKRMRRSGSDVEPLVSEEELALDAVKRLSEMKAALSDKQEVNRILRSGAVGSSDQMFEVKEMIDDLTRRLQDTFWSSSDPSPEKFVEALLTEASMLAANECMKNDKTFSIHHFRNMASTVHQACKEISEQYSHVHIGQICRDIARRWLVHGDDVSRTTKNDVAPAIIESVGSKKITLSLSAIEESEDTVDFVMDLNKLGEVEAVWSDDVGSSSKEKDTKPDRVTAAEEPSALAINGSAREASEIGSSRVALRVAFVMSFAEGYHSTKSSVHGSNDDENQVGNNAKEVPSTSSKIKTRPGLLSRTMGDGQRRKANVMEHARELLRVVFAKGSGGADAAGDPSISFMAESEDSSHQSRKTLTFAMRYRALRTAAVLCPQEALELVVQEEGYLSNSAGESTCSLQKCAYGSFLAKEIEEMGLPLPHSDLVMLSNMHFPSYARALWRHHRDKANGRLLLLLLEMSLKEADSDLTVTLLDEMARGQLPRTLLAGCECIFRTKQDDSNVSFEDKASLSILSALRTLGMVVLSEVHGLVANNQSQDLAKALPTLRRLGKLVEQCSDIPGGHEHLSQFISVMFGLLEGVREEEAVARGIAEILSGACSCLPNVEERREALDKLMSYESGRSALSSTRKATSSGSDGSSTAGSVSAVLAAREETYRPSACL